MQLLPWDKSFTEYQIQQNSNKKVENLVHNVLFNLIDIIFRIISFGFSGFANPKPVKQEVSCTVILPPMVSVLCNCICSICFKCWYSLSSHFVVRLWRRLIGFDTKMACFKNDSTLKSRRDNDRFFGPLDSAKWRFPSYSSRSRPSKHLRR